VKPGIGGLMQVKQGVLSQVLFNAVFNNTFCEFRQKGKIRNWPIVGEIFLVKRRFLDQGGDYGLFEVGWKFTS